MLAVINKRNVQEVLQLINISRYTSIQFTHEDEIDDKIYFLDLTIMRNDDGTISFDIYRKPTFTGRTITADSNHAFQHKMASYHAMAHRMVSVPMATAQFDREYARIIEIGRTNGYSRSTIVRILEKHRIKQDMLAISTLTPCEEPAKKRRSIIFTGKWNKKIRKACADVDVEAVPDSGSFKMRRHLTNTKDKKNNVEKAGIYEVRCQNGCDASRPLDE